MNFTRTGSDGKQTTNFYQGHYYVKELSGPNGYTIDKEEHEVNITWDTKPDAMNNPNKNNTTPDVEDPMGSEDAKPSTGIYVLEEGENFKQRILPMQRRSRLHGKRQRTESRQKTFPRTRTEVLFSGKMETTIMYPHREPDRSST